MSEYKSDYSQVQFGQFTVENSDGIETVDLDAFSIPVLIPISMVGELLAAYDPSSGTSPSVTYSRPLSRAILDALKRYVEEGNG